MPPPISRFQLLNPILNFRILFPKKKKKKENNSSIYFSSFFFLWFTSFCISLYHPVQPTWFSTTSCNKNFSKKNIYICQFFFFIQFFFAAICWKEKKKLHNPLLVTLFFLFFHHWCTRSGQEVLFLFVQFLRGPTHVCLMI